MQKLSKGDEHILLSREWLNDTIVNASQRLIAKSFPLRNGLQDTNLGQTLAFEIQRSPFVQVLHTGYGHWVTISTYGCDLGFVDIHDSLPPAMTSSLQRQIAAIICLTPTHREINIRYISLICFYSLIFILSLTTSHWNTSQVRNDKFRHWHLPIFNDGQSYSQPTFILLDISQGLTLQMQML